MNPDTRHKGIRWNLGEAAPGGRASWEQATCALLMDIRDELERMNAILHCHNFLAIPHKLDSIKRNTARKRKPRK